MTLEITAVKTNDEIKAVVNLAQEIWKQHFTPIIGERQVEYMLMKYQSFDAVKSQIFSGAEYYLVKAESQMVGYFCLIPDLKNNKIMISKIYVKNSMRGKGIGRFLLDYIENKCVPGQNTVLWLTVNKFNDKSINWYKHQGFIVTDNIKKDIGEGFYMDDYIMEIRI